MKKIVSLITLVVLSSTPAFAEQRIVSAGSTITELFYALGAQDQLVAVDTTSRSYVKNNDKPQVGYHRQLSSEGIMALEPTMLLGSSEMGPETTLTQLKSAHVNIKLIPDGDKLSDLEKRIDIIAQITGKEQKAKVIKQKLETDLAHLKAQPLSSPPKIMFLMINEDRAPTAAGRNTPVDAMIKLAGGVNPVHDLFTSYKSMSYEAIINLQPDYILISQRALDKFGNKEKVLSKLPLLMATPAGQEQHIIAIPSRTIIGGLGLETIEQAAEINQRLHAENKDS